MAFVLNEGYDNERAIDAHKWIQDGTYTVFVSRANEQVYAVPTGAVHAIRKTD